MQKNLKMMKMKMIKYILIVCVLGSCYTSNKAKKQLNKANDKFPDVVAKFTRDQYPCIDKKIDTAYSIDTLYQYINVECPPLFPTIDTFYKTNTLYKNRIVKQLVAIPQRTITITKSIEDSAKIKLMASENKMCSDKLVKAENKIERLRNWVKWLFIILIISILLNALLITKR